MVIFLAVTILILLIVILMQCRLTVGFTFSMESLACSAFVTVYLFGKIPAKKITVYPLKKNKKKKGDKAGKVRKKSDLTQLRMSVWVLAKLFFKSLIIKDFRLYVREGTGDACQTALLYGLLWNLAGFMQGCVLQRFKVKNKEFKIETDFKEKVWKLNFDCIFSLKIVNIISLVRESLKIYLKNRKGGDAGVRSSNRRTDDYSHAKY